LRCAIASVLSLTAIVGPVLMTTVFSVFAGRTAWNFPGAPFLLAAGLLAIGIVTLRRTLAGTVPNSAARAGKLVDSHTALRISDAITTGRTTSII